MSLNQRISPSLSEKAPNLQAPVCRQDGFSLIELMVVIAILGVLMLIGASSWSSYKEETKVDSAKDKIVSIFQQARLKALSSGFQQDVALDWANDRIRYVKNGSSTTLDFAGAIDLEGYKCTAPVAASTTGTSTFKFKRRGSFSASYPGSGNPVRVRVSSASSGKVFIITVNTVTGRVSVARACP